MGMGRSRSRAFLALTLVLTAVCIEGLFFCAGRLLQSKWAMWKPPGAPVRANQPLSYDEYRARRDPLLGWPHPAQYGKDLARNGAHPNPHFPDDPPPQSCLSLYGDSFTRGGDTSSAAKNWGNVLSAQLQCYVANFGVSGYGTDQAYLRFERNQQDPSPAVVFGIHTENVLRNLTRIRDILNYERWFALKPRFILDDRGELELVPLPDLTQEEYLRVVGVTPPPLTLAHENFQPGGPAGVVALTFPFTLSVLRNAARFHGFRARLLRQPEWLDFLEPGHPLRGLEITVGITRKFVELAAQREKSPRVVILPHPDDFKYFRKQGRWPHQPLRDALIKADIPFSDFGPYLLAEAAQQAGAIDSYFGETLHYNDQGNAVLARFVREQLSEDIVVQADEPAAAQTGTEPRP